MPMPDSISTGREVRLIGMAVPDGWGLDRSPASMSMYFSPSRLTGRELATAPAPMGAAPSSSFIVRIAVSRSESSMSSTVPPGTPPIFTCEFFVTPPESANSARTV
jgi:hypothetical protein